MTRNFIVKGAIAALVCAISMCAQAMADPPQRIDVPAGDLATALQSVSKKTGVELVFNPEQLKGMRTKGVSGVLSSQDAVRKLLEGTKLELRTDSATGAMMIGTSQSPPGAVVNQRASDPVSDPAGKDPSSNVRLAQTDQAPASGPSSDQSATSTADTSNPQEAGHIPEILVRGSKILNVDLKRTEDDPQPYYILDSTQIAESGATNVEDFLKQQLSMNTTIQTNSQTVLPSNGATSSINLRGLGVNETLILIDGRRSAVGGVGDDTTQPDINGIPLSAIERIEVLPSSASAIYGGAALGGVVNIILKKNFQGGEIGATFDTPTSGHAPIRTVNGTYGFSLESIKTQVMVSANFSDGDSLELQDRLNLVGRGISTILGNSPSYLSSSFSPFAGNTTNISSSDTTPTGAPVNLTLRNGTPLNSPITFIPKGAGPGSNLSSGLLANAGKYDFGLPPGIGPNGLQSTLGVTPTRKALLSTIRTEFTPDISGFVEFSTNSNSTHAPFTFFGTGSVPSTAPDNPFQQDVTVSFPVTQQTFLNTDSVTQSVTVGAIAHLPWRWGSELDYTWSRNSYEYAYEADDSTALSADLASGALNPFVDTAANPLNLSRYLAPTTYSGNSTVNDILLRLSGPIGQLPWGTPMLTVGLEHRLEGTHDEPFQVTYPLNPDNNVDELTFGQSQTINSVYAEATVPLVGTANSIPGVRSLDLQLAGRSEHYSVGAGTLNEYISPAFLVACCQPPQGVHTTVTYTSTNPTIALKYKPVDDVTLRASYAKAFLPPTQLELLPNPTVTFDENVTDPRNGQNYSVGIITGGNPALKPQTATDWDFGAIFQPQEEWLKGLRVDLEYYRITQPNYITNPTAQEVVSDPTFASRVTRDPTTGLITTVNTSPVNATEYKTDGFDLTVDYRKSTDIGAFNFRFGGTFIEHDLRQYGINSPFLEYVGFPGDGGEARLKANAGLTWEYRGWKVGWNTTFYGHYFQLGSPDDPLEIQTPGSNSAIAAAQGGFNIPSQIYHDLLVGYAFPAKAGTSRAENLVLSNLTLQLGIRNIFNTLPPFDANYGPYYYSPYGDPRLRSIYVSVRKGF